MDTARPRALTVATVSRSLALQSPEAWRVLQDRGYVITFAAARDAWTEALTARNPGSTFHALRAERSLRPGTLLQLARHLRHLSRQDWDLVQVQSPIISVLWRLVGTRRSRGRTVYVVHGFHFQPGERSLQSHAVRLVEVALAHRTLALATVSEADQRFVRALPRFLRPRVLTALPGAGVPLDEHRASDLPRELPAHVPYALFVGDLNSNKDPMWAVHVVDACRAQGLELDLVVIGEGPLAGELEAATSARPWLRLLDRTDVVPRWMAHAQVLLAPSHREGLPRVVIEALAAGTPVVARRNRGSAELLGDGVGAVLTDEDAAAWADAVEGILSSPPDVETMRARARGYGVDRFRVVYGSLVAEVEAHRRQHGDHPHQARRLRREHRGHRRRLQDDDDADGRQGGDPSHAEPAQHQR
ncbi:glycosyltransferase [Ornithinimicrobium cerasi]|uniref:glycosyltransferase n=1 Tax=Ornithinimicrobium cerasi TaxID=2248773 RepID=UPI000EFE04A4|nr:glycosyltransferase [Ornithinimicrobium cerasi]